MFNLVLIVFCLAIAGILQTYLFYPLYMLVRYKKTKLNFDHYGNSDQLPEVAVLIAAYNEEKVIREKIESLFNQSYPAEKIKVYIGSDASNDGMETIIKELEARWKNLQLVRFEGRMGKIGIINHLQSLGDENILIMTDANVIFTPEAIFELVKYLKDERVGLVAGNIVKKSIDNDGIAYQEKAYLNLENRIKAAESNAYGLIMGAEGGCYAIRNSLFNKVPQRFIVDDFFITLQVIQRGKQTLFNKNATCYEDVSSDNAGEYRRKVRISSGNFQNLFFFRKVLFKFWTPVAIMFWSHKVLRWLTPFLLLLCFLSSLYLMKYSSLFVLLFDIQLAGFLLPFFVEVFHINQRLIIFISHFYQMNFALLEGFFRYLRGIKSSVWEPVERNV